MIINYFNEHLGDFILSITPSIIHLIKPDKIRFLSRSSYNIFTSFTVSLTKAKKKGLELKTGLVKEVNWLIENPLT